MKIKGPGESPLLLLNVIKHLNRLKIPYAVVGAFAASYYGQVRASVDADAVISVKGHEEKAERLVAVLKEDGLKVERRRGDIHDPIRLVLNIEDKFHNRVDLLAGIRGMEEAVFKRAVKASFERSSIKIAGVEDFIAMKIFAGSPKDIQDAVGVLKVSLRKVDMALLKNLTRLYGRVELARLEKLLKNI